MRSPASVVIVGGGKMGEAILKGWLSSDEGPCSSLNADNIVVVNPGAERRDHLERTYGITGVASVEDAPAADIVVLAVKPQVMPEVLDQIAKLQNFAGGQEGPLFVSIAAGLPTSSFEKVLPAGAPVVRVMPNMPLQIEAGASGICGGSTASDEQVALVAQLFEALGVAVVVDEAQMDAVGALSGSGPAYVCAMIEALVEASVEEGLDEELAYKLAIQTFLGTAELLGQPGVSVAATRESICSPGGTTLAALAAMEEAGFAEAAKDGIHAAVKRSKELASCIS